MAGWRVAQFSIPGKERLSNLAMAHYNLGILMHLTENPKREIFHLKEGLKIGRQINHIDRQMVASMRLADAYLKINQLDTALYFANEADIYSKNSNFRGFYRGLNLSYIGDIYFKKGDNKLAKKYYYEGLFLSTEKNLKASIAPINHKLIQVFINENEKDSAIRYAINNLEIIKSISGESDLITNIGTAYEDVYRAYKLNNQADSAYKYQDRALMAKDSLFKTRINYLADFQNLSLEESLRLESLEREKIQTQSKIRTYSLLTGLFVLSIIGFILYRNNRQKQKANAVLEKTLSELRSTQAQLIQSEKLASLGELTAGIAHEIQNPLNFVNNFSELSVDLADELEDEIKKPELDRDLIADLTKDLKSNQEKINHHGKRASSIVKGMLEHSRASTGVKELTDINALANEYLRLAYSGIRAKDSNFEATLETHFDPNLPTIEVIPQDIGRVLLNLINNAFWAVKTVEKPLVIVKTEHSNNQLIIKVTDNGTGMPESVKAKIFQPFFTTKPTGQGTGLGLSLAYDIVTKGHGGSLEVQSTEGVGSIFILKLPV